MPVRSYLRIIRNKGSRGSREQGSRKAAFTRAVRSAGIRITHQRLEIFRAVASSDEHPDAEAVLRAVLPRSPMVSLDTVYRTLWLLADLGWVHPLGPRRATVRFDANIGNHHHFVCARCGMTRDFEGDVLQGIRIPDSVKDYGTVLASRIEVRGICRSCQVEKKKAATPRRRRKTAPRR